MSERFACGLVSELEFQHARDQARAESAGAGVAGLSRCEPAAAAQLSAVHTANESADTAAHWSVEFAVKAAMFREAHARSIDWVWPEDGGEPWRAAWRAAEWLKRHPFTLKPFEAAVRETLLDLRKSMLTRAGFGRVLPFPARCASRR
jgi:hypothetical protein